MLMKKSYSLLLAALLLTTSVSAQKALTPKQVQARISQIQKTGKTINESTLRANGLNPIGKIANEIGKASQSQPQTGLKVKKAQDITWPDASTIIDEQPEGTLHSAQLRSGNYTYAFWGYLFSGSYSYSVGTYVVADDAIYLKDPFHGFSTDTWLKLDKVDDENYVAHLPQAIYSVESTTDDGEDTTYVYYAARMVYDEAALYVEDSTSQDIAFTYKNGILAQADTTVDDYYGEPLAGISLTDNEFGLYGYVDNAILVKPNTEVKTELPATATISQYQITSTEYFEYIYPDSPEDNSVESGTNAELINVAFDGNDVYINNPSTKDSTSWIKGTIADGKATFLPQYIGADEEDGYHNWFTPATFTLVTDSSYLEDYGDIDIYRYYEAADKLELTYDADTKALVAPEGTSLIINARPDRISYLDTYDEVNLQPWTEVAVAPADPVINSVGEYFNDYGYSSVSFDIPNTDANGNLLNEDKLYYNVYTSDDTENPYALTEDEGYEEFNNPDPVNIPYSYNDGWDVMASGTSHTVYFYFDTNDIDSVGIQSIYTGGGETNKSKLVWFSLLEQHGTADGISSLEGNNSGVKSVSYYDISGRQVSAPKQAGIFVKETTYADGTKTSVKILKR